MTSRTGQCRSVRAGPASGEQMERRRPETPSSPLLGRNTGGVVLRSVTCQKVRGIRRRSHPPGGGKLLTVAVCAVAKPVTSPGPVLTAAGASTLHVGKASRLVRPLQPVGALGAFFVSMPKVCVESQTAMVYCPYPPVCGGCMAVQRAELLQSVFPTSRCMSCPEERGFAVPFDDVQSGAGTGKKQEFFSILPVIMCQRPAGVSGDSFVGHVPEPRVQSVHEAPRSAAF